MNEDHPSPVLGYFQNLAEAPGSVRPEGVLRELAAFFQADAVGLDSLDQTASMAALVGTAGALPTLPWQKNKDLASRLQRSLVAERVEDPQGVWLVSAVSRSAFAWIMRRNKRAWSDADRWHWTAAGQALANWRSRNAAAGDGDLGAVQRHLENVAAVTGRLTHDFGNYLTGILGFTELSLSQCTPDTAQHRFLQEVLQSAQQGAAWIHRLQLFCRRSNATAWPTRLASVIASEQERLRSVEPANIRWELTIPETLPLIDMDASALQMLFQEVVNNAREAMKDGGTISVSARACELTGADCNTILGAVSPGAYVEVVVADEGPGIPEEQRDRLFRELFFSTKPRRRGVGLLAVYGILQSSRGGMRFDFNGQPQGTSVRLYFPAASIAPVSTPPSTKAPHVLLAHHSPLLFDSLRVILEARGCRVTVVDSPQAALAVCSAPKTSFGLVVVDVNMPQMSGFDLARRILDHDRNANFLFLCTQPSFHGMNDDELPKRFELLRWPIQPAALFKTLQNALARAQGG